MATYKVIQDIEAEDKILGPLTLRQFIFSLIAVFCFYVCFILFTKHAAFLMVLFLPPGLFCGFFALPFGRDQPTEIWALAKLRYWFKPRRRIWNQSGVKELVTITVPKKIERVLTNGLSQTEVKSRLQALADTIDSRGWATKNISANDYGQQAASDSSERLINIGSLPQEVPSEVAIASDDILDETSNPIAKQFDTMINQSSRNHRQQLINQLNSVAAGEPIQQTAVPAGKWFMGHGGGAIVPAVTGATAPVMPTDFSDTESETTLSNNLSARQNSQQVSFGNLRTMQPLGSQAAADPALITNDPSLSAVPAVPVDQTPAVTPPVDPAILSLAKNNDLNVATLAREAQKNKGDEGQLQNEVVVSLH